MYNGKKLNNGYTTMEALSASIVSLLLKEGKVIIPELGYLELKVFPDKQTVLFKATENTTLFLASEGSLESHIYDNVSVPLKEGKVVSIPELGIFRPMKNADGSFRISYTISSALRKLLNEAKESENEARELELPVTPVNVADEKIYTPVVESVVGEQKGRVKKEEEKKKEEVEKVVLKKVGKENKTEYKETENKEKEHEKGIITAPKREIKVERKTPSHVRNTSKVGDLVVPQEGKARSNEVTKLGRIIAVAAALIVLAFIVWYFVPGNGKRNDHAFVTGNSEMESTQVIDQSNESAKSYESIDLPSLAERKYGNRIFWVYIYEANRDKISSPVNIPAGINLRIPNLWEDYKVDVMDSMEIKRAEILSDVMLKQKLQL
ncbi:hypothetical protein FACS189451_05050 [Bacteroidia bacterium]|nr:hypothetical protein FACS189446_0160 [Bacteroidia bacterium]GHT61921.1 hypothetical protein FACS189451_05050 [Bacteroidia bacterium]